MRNIKITKEQFIKLNEDIERFNNDENEVAKAITKFWNNYNEECVLCSCTLVESIEDLITELLEDETHLYLTTKYECRNGDDEVGIAHFYNAVAGEDVFIDTWEDMWDFLMWAFDYWDYPGRVDSASVEDILGINREEEESV